MVEMRHAARPQGGQLPAPPSCQDKRVCKTVEVLILLARLLLPKLMDQTETEKDLASTLVRPLSKSSSDP